MAINDIFKVRTICYISGLRQLGINVGYFKQSTLVGAGVTNLQIAGAFETRFAPLYKPVMYTGADWRGVGIQKIFPTPPSVESFANVLFGPGTVAGDALPPQISGLVSLITASAGRNYRGRKYIPFPGESDNAAGNCTGGYVTAINLIGQGWATSITVTAGASNAQFDPVIWHRGPTLANTSTPIISWFGHSAFATQRRRGQYGAQNATPI